MQCLACNHEAAVADFGDPLCCPQCGILYEMAMLKKFNLLKAELEQVKRQEQQLREDSERTKAVTEVDLQSMSLQDMKAFYDPPAAVASGFNTRFLTLLGFMTRLAFASIPALLVLWVAALLLKRFLGLGWLS